MTRLKQNSVLMYVFLRRSLFTHRLKPSTNILQRRDISLLEYSASDGSHARCTLHSCTDCLFSYGLIKAEYDSV